MSRALLLAALVLVGCGARQKQTENLLDTSLKFQEGLRWGRYEDAASHLPAAQREAFLDEHDELADELRIDDYEVLRVHFRDNQQQALVQVKYTWHLDGVGIVKETVSEQRWQLRGKRWLMEEERKKRGDDMPGIRAKGAGDRESTDGGNASGDEPL